MRLPIIPIEPIVKPAVEEKIFDRGYITNLNILSSPMGDSYVYLKVCPSTQSGELDEANAEIFNVELWDCVSKVPEAAAALAAILNCVPAIREYARN